MTAGVSSGFLNARIGSGFAMGFSTIRGAEGGGNGSGSREGGPIFARRSACSSLRLTNAGTGSSPWIHLIRLHCEQQVS